MQYPGNKSKRLISALMSALLLFNVTGTAFAHAEGEEDGEHDETPYSITIYQGKEPNKHGTLAYTITSHEDGTISDLYDVTSDTEIIAYHGDTITLYPEANDGYVLSSIGYVKEERVEQSFNIKSTTEQKDGSYTFTMPDNNIYVGAAFYDKDDYYVTKEAGTSNTVANVDPLHVLELGLNHAWLHESAEEVSVDMHLDKRILSFGETAGKEMTFRMEIREVADSGYVLVGAKEYTAEELKKLVEEKSAGTQTDEKNREFYILRDVAVPVDEDKDFTLDREVYCTAMFTLDGWTNAIGAPYYRWGYSGGDRAYILEDGTPIPTSMVYLYNLEPETYHGALVAEAIDRVEEEMGITIETRYFTSQNMTECIGYLAEWPGYQSRGDVEPSTKVYKKKIVLYCSLPSMVRDKLGDYIRETGANPLNSKLTAYGAERSFEEFYKTQETESTVFTAALSLSLLTYEAYTAVPESEYGNHELWAEFKAAYDECKAIINMTSEQEESVYTNARLKLLDVYLRIIGKVQLTTDFQFVIEEYDTDHYKITVDQSNFPEDLKVNYRWYDTSKNDYLIIPKNQLYKVSCSISAAEDGPYYGFKSISLAVPGELEYNISATYNSVSVEFSKYESLTNTPEPITYAAELYQNDELKSVLSNQTGNTLVFAGLEEKTQYTVRIYATNIVGRTTYLSETVTTDARPEEPEVPSTPSTPSKPDKDDDDHDYIDMTGGSSSITTEKNPDGSTTTTKTDKDGTVTESTKNPDGSITATKTDKDGTVTTTEKDAKGNQTETITKADGSKVFTANQKDGSRATASVDAAGIVTAEVEVSKKAVQEAARQGQAVQLPIPAVSSEKDGKASTVTVDLPKDSGKTDVVIPMAEVTPGTVAVIVHLDSTEEIVIRSRLTENGLGLTLEGGATLKIVNNAKDFDDVKPNDWFSNATDFVSSRNLFAGTSETEFSPNAPMTMEMLFAVAHNFMGKPETNASGLAGAKPEDWFHTASNWAVEMGLTNGLKMDMLGTNKPISREDTAVLLFNLSGKANSYIPGAETLTKLNAFSDIADMDPANRTALAWAVENGIMNGMGDGTFGFKGSNTRAQTGAVMMNFNQKC